MSALDAEIVARQGEIRAALNAVMWGPTPSPAEQMANLEAHAALPAYRGIDPHPYEPWTPDERASAGALVPPKPPLTVTASDALPEPPSEAEILAVLALPLDARFALCADRGPGWTVHPAQPQAVPRLRPPPATLIPDTVGAWLPAGIDGIVDLVASALDAGRRAAMSTICAEVNANVTIRLAALRVLGRVWR